MASATPSATDAHLQGRRYWQNIYDDSILRAAAWITEERRLGDLLRNGDAHIHVQLHQAQIAAQHARTTSQQVMRDWGAWEASMYAQSISAPPPRHHYRSGSDDDGDKRSSSSSNRHDQQPSSYRHDQRPPNHHRSGGDHDKWAQPASKPRDDQKKDWRR